MAHFAKLNENNIVETVIVVDNEVIDYASGLENEQKGIEYLKNLFGQNTNWKQTSYNHNFRARFAAPNYLYDSIKDIFLPQKPYPSWNYDETEKQWLPPVPYPQDDYPYVWIEESQQWVVAYAVNPPPTTPTP